MFKRKLVWWWFLLCLCSNADTDRDVDVVFFLLDISLLVCSIGREGNI